MKTLLITILLTPTIFLAPLMAQEPASQAERAADMIRGRQYAEAVAILRGDLAALATEAPDFSQDELLLLRARALHLAGEHAAAEVACNELLAGFPESEWGHKAKFLKAHSLAARGRYEQALAIYETEAARLFSEERKDEVAQSLIGFAAMFAKVPDPADLDAPRPDYQKACRLYKEVLDVQCSAGRREEAHFAMIRMSGHLQAWDTVLADSLTYLQTYDPSWRGEMDSQQRLTFQKNPPAKHIGSHRSEVRYRMAEALHRNDRRPLAVRYLEELLGQMDDGTLESPAGLAADATWLKLMAMRLRGGRVNDVSLWVTSAKAYLAKFPKHLHANETAFMVPSMLASHQQAEKAIAAYQEFLQNPVPVVEDLDSLETETPSAFLQRQEKAARKREEASYQIGALHLRLNQFDDARASWTQTAKDYPNGSRWADSQQGLVDVDFREAMQAIRDIPDAKAGNQVAAAARASGLLQSFLKSHPLSDRAPRILFLLGRIPHQAALDMDAIDPPAANMTAAQKESFQKAIQVWGELLSKYPDSSEATQAREHIGRIYEERLGDLEKALTVYKQSKSSFANMRRQVLTSKRLIASSPKVFRTDEEPVLALSLRNIEKLTIRQYWLDLDSYFRKARKLADISELDVDLVEPDKQWELDVGGFKKYVPMEHSIPVPFPENRPGVCVLKVEGGGFLSTTVIVRSDIDIAVRAGRKELLAFATNWRDGGTPCAGVNLLIADGGKVIATGQTGKDGVLHLQSAELSEVADLRVLALSKSGAATCDLDLGSLIAPPVMIDKAWFNTPRSWYRPGETVELSGLLRTPDASVYTIPPPDQRAFTLTCVEQRTGRLVHKSAIALDEHGGFSTTFRVPNGMSEGRIAVTLSRKVGTEGIDFETTIAVREQQRNRVVLKLGFARSWTVPGEAVTGKITARYHWGAPVAERMVEVSLPGNMTLKLVTDAEGRASFDYDTGMLAPGSIAEFSVKMPSESSNQAREFLDIDPLGYSIEADVSHGTIAAGETFEITAKTLLPDAAATGKGLTLEVIQQLSVKADPILGLLREDVQQLAISTVEEKIVQTHQITTDATTGLAKQQVTLDEGGRFILRIHGKDDRGRLVMAESFIEIYGERSHQKIRLLVDKSRLQEGGEAEIDVWSRLKSPTFALLSIEANSLVEYRVLKLTPGKNKLTVPLTQRHAPVFRAAIMAMHARKFYSSDEILPVERVLKVTTEIEGLGADREAPPGTKLKVRVAVRDGNGAPQDGMVSLAIIDERDPHAVLTTSPFVRSHQLAGFTLGTSCGLRHRGTQSAVNLTVRQEEERLRNANNRAGRRAEDDLQMALRDAGSRADQVKRSLYTGEGYFNLGRFDEAERQFQSVLRIDPYNKAARRWLERVASVKSDYYRAAYDETRAGFLPNDQGGQSADFISSNPFVQIPGIQAGTSQSLSNLSTSGLRSGDAAITRNSIDAILNNPGRNGINATLNNPNRNSIDAVMNNPNGRGFLNNSSNASWATRNFIAAAKSGITEQHSLLPPIGGHGPGVTPDVHSHEPTRIWSLTGQRIPKAGTTLEVPLPAESGSWKLLTHASSASGNLGQSVEKLITRQPYTLSLSSPATVIEGDQLTPSMILTRKKGDDGEKITVTLKAMAGKKLLSEQKHVFNFLPDETSHEISATAMQVPDAGALTLTLTGARDLKLTRTLPIRPKGLPVADRGSLVLDAGAKSLTLELPPGARRQKMQLRITPGISPALRRLALSRQESLLGWHIPLHQEHPAGRLLAIASVIDHARRQNPGDDAIADLIAQAERLAAELAVTRKDDGSWTSVNGRSKGDLGYTAMAFEALKLAEKLQLNVDSDSLAAAQAWLGNQQAAIESNDVDARALVQYALSCGGAADFSTCNRLFRERGKLGDAGKALLAATFVNLERPEFAKSLLQSLADKDKWDTKSERILCSQTFIAGRALSTAAVVSPDSPMTVALKELILSGVGVGGFASDLDRGAAIAGLAQVHGKDDKTDARVTVTINGKPLGKFSSDKPEALTDIAIPDDLIAAGKNVLKFTVEGRGKLHAAATLGGFTAIPAKPKADEKFWLQNHRYYREGLSFHGRRLKSLGTSPAKSVRKGERVRVQFTVEQLREDFRESLVIASIPAGFVYEKGSLRGGHSGARIENRHLVITFDGQFKSRTLSYTMIARHRGTWHQPPTMFLPLRDPAGATHVTAGALMVVPESADDIGPYVKNISERRELAALHFGQGEFAEARGEIMAIRKARPEHEDVALSRMLLWIETSRPQPEARLLVESFEVLNEREPDLVIPFDKILKVGEAYRQLKEFERGLEVFTATIEAGFAEDAYVGAALEDQGRFLDAVDYQKALWMLYPDEGEITNAWFALAQQVYAKSSSADKMEPRHGTEERPTEMSLIKESSTLLDDFLLATPGSPLADDAAFSQANALFSLKEFARVVRHAHACITRYPDSEHAGSFRYMEALGSFWQRDYDAALKAASEVARGSSEDKNLAAFITAQIYHAKGQPVEATKWYESIKDIYPDARESIAFFEQKMVKLDEAEVLKSGEKAQMKLRFRNIKEAHLQIYRVDLMKLYLREKSLSNVADVNLAGIAPKHEMTVQLGDGKDFRDREKLITLPVKDDGAYLVICRGDYLYASGLVLITPLKMEVQEDLAAQSLRVNISDQITGDYLDNVHVKAIGINDSGFKSGETDLRGVWKAENITNRPTVIARDAKGRYAFFRSTSSFTQANNNPARQVSKPQVDFKGNFKSKQSDLGKDKSEKYEEFRRSKGKGVKAREAIKK